MSSSVLFLCSTAPFLLRCVGTSQLLNDALFLTRFLKLIRQIFAIMVSPECFHTLSESILNLSQVTMKAFQCFRLVGEIYMVVSWIFIDECDVVSAFVPSLHIEGPQISEWIRSSSVDARLALLNSFLIHLPTIHFSQVSKVTEAIGPSNSPPTNRVILSALMCPSQVCQITDSLHNP